MSQKEIVVLGSTGSVGSNTLKVAKELGIRVKGLAAKSNSDFLFDQIREFSPEVVALYDSEQAIRLQKLCPHLSVLSGIEGISAVASLNNALVVSAISGTLGLLPTVAAIQAGNSIALANKEVLVSGGALITQLVRKHKVQLLPLDSEHSAIFQCLQGVTPESVNKLILTASGGPFLHTSLEELQTVTAQQALKHPNWSMGTKITIDSSTLMNKGLEVIEAHWLFNMPANQIQVVIHPQSIIHSMVELLDHSILAQLSIPDMCLPIQYALTYPNRLKSTIKPLDFTQCSQLTFLSPDTQRFRCLDLAYQTLKAGKSYACFLNAANEILVHRFLKEEISWVQIAQGIENLLMKHAPICLETIDDVLAVDCEARKQAEILKFT